MIYNTIGQMIKEQVSPKLPVFIPAYNNPSYVQNMVEKLINSGFKASDIIVSDNFSKYPGMRDTLENLSNLGCHVIKKFTNDGPREYYLNKKLYNWFPECFIVTDPDIELNDNLPSNWVEILIETSKKYELYKVGFALDIDGEDLNIKDIMFNQMVNMYDWEKQFYLNIIDVTDDGDPIYRAAIDTTFCLVNKSFARPYQEPMQVKDICARIGGNFTAQHYGWYNNPPIPKDELFFYLSYVPPQWSFTSNEIKRRKGL